jgi:hypothetical protein
MLHVAISYWYVQSDRTDIGLAQFRVSRQTVKSLSVTADEGDGAWRVRQRYQVVQVRSRLGIMKSDCPDKALTDRGGREDGGNDAGLVQPTPTWQAQAPDERWFAVSARRR